MLPMKNNFGNFTTNTTNTNININNSNSVEVGSQNLFNGPMQMVPSNQAQNPNILFTNIASVGFKRLLAEMRVKQFDSIRFAAYRTASKLRFIQQRTLFNMIDICRVVETFREFGLYHLNDPQISLDYLSTFRLLSRIYCQMPTNFTIPLTNIGEPQAIQSVISNAAEILLGWLGYALDMCTTGRLNLNGLKIALSILTNSKPVDKFKYHFTLFSDQNGAVVFANFESYLEALLKLPISVFEGTNFFYRPQLGQAIITSHRTKNVVQEDFLDCMLSDQGPQVLVWLTIFHRLISVSNVRHYVQCEGCKRDQICGLRYKCTRCPHYNLCQDCFWIGVTTDQHTNAHDVKEYSAASKSHSRQFGHTLRKSFQFGRIANNLTTLGNPPQSTVPNCLSESHKSNDPNLPVRPHIGSIFEWNSDVLTNTLYNTNVTEQKLPMNATIANLSTPVLLPRPLTSQTPTMQPFSSVRSPVPNRRLQQLNPLFNSMPLNATVPQSHLVQTINRGPDKNSANIKTLVASHLEQTQTPQNRYVAELSSQPISGQTMICSSKRSINQNAIPDDMSENVKLLSHSSLGNSRKPDYASSEEHNSIARFAAQLAAANALNQQFEKFGDTADVTQTQRNLIAQLQEKNRKILKEIERLRLEQQKQAAVIAAAGNIRSDGVANFQELFTQDMIQASNLGQLTKQDFYSFNENTNIPSMDNPKQVANHLKALRLKKDELENRMNNLQRSRTDLMLQLETLVHLLSISTGNPNQDESNILNRINIPFGNVASSHAVSKPLSDIQSLGHNSRTDLRVPNCLPRRSTSLSHTVSSRNFPDNFRYPSTQNDCKQSALDNKTTALLDRSSSTVDNSKLTPLYAPNTRPISGDKSTTNAPNRNLDDKSTDGLRYLPRHSPDLDYARSSDLLTEKYRHLLMKGIMTPTAISKSLRVSSGGHRHRSIIPSLDMKTDLFSSNIVDHSKSTYSDSGSDAYLYSDPELCMAISTTSTTMGSIPSGLTLTSRHPIYMSTSTDHANSTMNEISITGNVVVSAIPSWISAPLSMKTNIPSLINTGPSLIISTMPSGHHSDNYEYAGMVVSTYRSMECTNKSIEST